MVANSVQGLVMHLDDIPTEEIEDVNIPAATPFFYQICIRTGCAVMSNNHEPTVGFFHGVYISDDRKKRSFLDERPLALGFGRPSSDQEYVTEWVQ
jgi:hypothetical protein